MKSIQSVLAAALFSCAAFNANATIYQFTFSNDSAEIVQIGDGGVVNPTGVFAYLDYDTVLNQFRLYDNTSDGYLTISDPSVANRAMVAGVAFNFGSTISIFTGVTYPSSFYDSGAVSDLGPRGLPPVMTSNNFDRAIGTFTDGLINGESETFAITGFDNSSFSNLESSNGKVLANSIAIRVFNGGGGPANRTSWFTASSVAVIPEPETYAMFLAGLGLLGFVSRRKTEA